MFTHIYYAQIHQQNVTEQRITEIYLIGNDKYNRKKTCNLFSL